jgi:hypothetical protein
MLSLYYKIWVDAIVSTKSLGSDEFKNWKVFTIIPISALQGINLLTILLWIRGLSDIEFAVLLPVKLFNVILLNEFIAVILTFFIPFLLLNYLLIFSNQRYKTLLKEYRADNGKRYLWYIAITGGLWATPYLLKLLF